MTDRQPLRKRILALDLGEVRTGVAVSDPFGWTAQPVEVVQTRSTDHLIRRISELVREYEVETLLVGMPLNMDGTEGAQARWVRQFGARLSREIPGPEIVYWDERLTTFESEEVLIESGVKSRKRKSRRDKIAAALILRSYLEHQRRTRPSEPSPSDPPSAS
jgi:putative Holliday junction resolvase